MQRRWLAQELDASEACINFGGRLGMSFFGRSTPRFVFTSLLFPSLLVSMDVKTVEQFWSCVGMDCFKSLFGIRYICILGRSRLSET